MTGPLLHTRRWVEQIVIGLNLCPFAAKPHKLGRVRYVLEDSGELQQLNDRLLYEARYLLASSPKTVETTLIVHPKLLTDFQNYLDYLWAAEELLRQQQMEGILQIASFHPDYQFAGTDAEAASNYTNRSPYPMLHLLREESIETALEEYGNPDDIPRQNIARMEGLGVRAIKNRLQNLKEE
ncbi:MAG: DUF1415 family protein [Bacteroidetes bacterium]|jgi:hypothetical protein|nr:DUF1415 family protein [Bacteroidota bacterium]